MTEQDWRIAVEIAAAARIKEAKLEGLCFPEWFGWQAERDHGGMENYREMLTACSLAMFRAVSCAVANLWATYALDDTPEARFVNKTYVRIHEHMGSKGDKPMAWHLAIEALRHANQSKINLDEYEPVIVTEDEMSAYVEKQRNQVH